MSREESHQKFTLLLAFLRELYGKY